MKAENSKNADSYMTSKKIFYLVTVMCSIFFVYQADAQEKDDICTDGRLNSAQIRALVTNKKAEGTSLDRSATWEEIQYSDGTAVFINKDNGKRYEGKWKIQDDQICWCYGDCKEDTCKIMEADDNCSVWYYINPDNGHKRVAKIYNFSDI